MDIEGDVGGSPTDEAKLARRRIDFEHTAAAVGTGNIANLMGLHRTGRLNTPAPGAAAATPRQ